MREFFAKGKRGIIYKDVINGKEVAVKIKNPKSGVTGAIGKEAEFLQFVNKYGLGPKFISFENGELMMEFVDGAMIGDFFERENKRDIIEMLRRIFAQLFLLDQLKLNKLELTNPYKHIIIVGREPVLIDFERCRFSKKPKNTTQFVQYITSKKISEILKNKKILIDRKKMLKSASDYKKQPTRHNLEKIIKLIS